MLYGRLCNERWLPTRVDCAVRSSSAHLCEHRRTEGGRLSLSLSVQCRGAVQCSAGQASSGAEGSLPSLPSDPVLNPIRLPVLLLSCSPASTSHSPRDVGCGRSGRWVIDYPGAWGHLPRMRRTGPPAKAILHVPLASGRPSTSSASLSSCNCTRFSLRSSTTSVDLGHPNSAHLTLTDGELMHRRSRLPAPLPTYLLPHSPLLAISPPAPSN